jgi:hypothetical protein
MWGLHRRGVVVAFVLVAVGLVWIGQGLGMLRGGSFMVGDPRWAVLGAACVAAGAVLAVRGRRSAR